MEVPLFATYRLGIIHLVAALPFGWLAASSIRRVVPQRLAVVTIAIALTAFSILIGSSLSHLLKQWEAGYALRWLVRTGIASSIVVWWLACLPIRHETRLPSHYQWAWTILIGLAIPWIYGLKQSEVHRENFLTWMGSMRLEKASRAIACLEEIDGRSQINGTSPSDWRRKVSRQVREAQMRVHTSISRNASLNEQLERVMLLLSLDRLDEAVPILEKLPSSDPSVSLLLAVSAREKKDWTGAEAICRAVLSNRRENEKSQRIDPIIFQVLGEALVYNKKIQEAIDCYKNAIMESPENRADFEMRLGSLLAESGNMESAKEHYRRAVQANPLLESDFNRRIRGIQNTSCRIFW
jgi:predicted negative regulator of RcsB-dependent stress response